MITAWNKIDACPNPAAVRALAASRPDVVAVSGATGEGLDELLEMVAVKLAENMVDMEVRCSTHWLVTHPAGTCVMCTQGAAGDAPLALVVWLCLLSTRRLCRRQTR